MMARGDGNRSRHPSAPVLRYAHGLPSNHSNVPAMHSVLKTSLAACAFALTAFAPAFVPTAHAQSALPTINLNAGMYAIHAEVADNPASRERGLMYRQNMPANAGMLFVFDEKAGHCFWMKNTNLPLSIAFLADDGSIVNIEDMAPQTEDNHCPRAAVRYALEMNKGWFAQKGIKSGAKIGGLPAPKQPQ